MEEPTKSKRWLFFLCTLPLLLFCTSCRTTRTNTEYVYVDRVSQKTDTVLKWDVDTIIVDRVIVKTDTMVTVETNRTHVQKKTEYKTIIRTDTVTVTKAVTNTEVVYKEKPLKWWQKMFLYCGIGSVLGVAIMLIINFKRFFKN